ncbi:hypothetical protein AGDE_15802 [Angomonas deanei]|uniref:Flagellar attachment zone protein 1 conserved domain-containing protein n=1 Tax=Angomonas deanei TaxID=59799 RepID=A0A7G2CN51_9TRYP|nr:hypothetical protein AGDE_15802 [Angomonas deanei]CAD2221280.1 hypothetical protein, conserved [Angomonas deanei]|eukprot:EPY18410.1 hypothetical protein AGDE_15802 [Angomonas deanei]
MKGKTRHTVRFRGDCWGNLSDQEALEAAFKADVEKAAKVKPEELNSLNFKVQAECMVAEFILYHPKKDKSRMATVHKALQEYDFPQVCALYP